MSHHFEIFKKYILERSIEKSDLRTAILEWDINTSWEEDEYGDARCCCTHSIKYVTEIINRENEIITEDGTIEYFKAIVGSKCILHVSNADDFEEYEKNIFKDIKAIESVRKRLSKLRLKFGKHKDKLFSEIPEGYCSWYKENYEGSRCAKPAIKRNMHDFNIFLRYIRKD